jgi:hypothetical protein
MIKNLLKIESEKEIAKSKDIFKILLTLVLYTVIFGLFKAGLDYQKIVPAKNIEKPESIKEYNYEISSNGSLKEIKFNEKKSLSQILDSHFEENIEIRILRDGTKVESIFGNKNVKILLNGKEINVNLIPETPVSENSLIQIFY